MHLHSCSVIQNEISRVTSLSFHWDILFLHSTFYRESSLGENNEIVHSAREISLL